VNKFAHVRFEPSGFTGNQEIPIAKSIIDYIFRWLGSRFLSADDKAAIGLIDRSAIVDDAPAAFGASALQPNAGEGPSSVDEAISRVADAPRASDAPRTGETPPETGGPKATAVATEQAPVPAPAPKAELPVINAGSNGHSNGNGHANGNGKTNGNGNSGGLGAITLSLGGATRVSFQTQADAPSCADCGSIMVRNGSCYKCLNCGSTSGCS
jgi:ribonucleoside-diphosphate reductase alpha chain